MPAFSSFLYVVENNYHNELENVTNHETLDQEISNRDLNLLVDNIWICCDIFIQIIIEDNFIQL